MKTSTILASFLLSALTTARPMEKRDMVTKTETVYETLVVYTTVWDDEVAATPTPVVQAKPTTQPALFYEQPKPSTPAPAKEEKPTSQYTPSAAAYTPPPAAKQPSPSPAPTSTQAPPPPPPPPVVEKPTTTAAPYVAPAPTKEAEQPKAPASSATPSPSIVPVQQAAPSPAPSSPASSSGSSGKTYSGEMTIYNPAGNLGACGKNLNDDDPIVALGAPTMGASTYDVMTGAATNQWCGKKIQITYNGKTTIGTIEDKCPGCAAGDIDLSPKLWKELTGMDPALGGRFKVEWSPLN